MEKRCLIITGGEFSPVEDYTDSDYVIACDKGYEYAKRCGIKPDLTLGDFDSYDGEVENCEVHRCQPEKDDTDTMLAIKEALNMGYKHISLRCALGGRMDHLIANIQTFAFVAKHGAVLDITDSNTIMCSLNPGLHLVPRREGYSLSLFALTDSCTGVNLKRVKYPLKDAEINSFFPIGVSNEWLEDEAEISLESGILLLVMSKL